MCKARVFILLFPESRRHSTLPPLHRPPRFESRTRPYNPDVAKKHEGTLEYAPVDMHAVSRSRIVEQHFALSTVMSYVVTLPCSAPGKGTHCTPRGDVEMLGYQLVDWFGTLPWSVP